MKVPPSNSNNSIIVSLFIGISIIISTVILNDAYKYKFKSAQTISVTGMAKKDFEADLVKWSSSFVKKDFDLKQASKDLNKDREIVKKFLKSKGVDVNEVTFDAVNITKDFLYETSSNGSSVSTFNGYVLTQNFSIESKKLDVVEKVSREITDLISKGIELNSSLPSFYYSKLEDLKLELIAKATANAKLRAENISKEADARLGELTEADMGVFQITGQNDNEDYSYGGVFNTSSRKKTASITIKLNFRSN